MSSGMPRITVRIRLAWFAAAALCLAAPAFAAQTVVLPASACPQSDPLFASGFETKPTIPSLPSNGSGGAFPGNLARTINVPSLGSRTYYLHLPSGYSPSQSWPLLLALRGAGLPTANGAQAVRNNWASWSDSAGFIVIAVAGNSTIGGWGANGDFDEISAALDDAAAAYNVEQSRIYLWGFSAGAHYGHALALNNTDYFAAYGVSAGALRAYACDTTGAPSCTSLLGGAQPKIPVDIHIGTSDSLYPEALADRTRFTNAGWVLNDTLHFVPFSGGHTYTVAQLGEIWNHLCPFALGP